MNLKQGSFSKITKMPLQPTSTPIPKSITDPKSAETFVKELGIEDAKCIHGLPFFACMPCSHWSKAVDNANKSRSYICLSAFFTIENTGSRLMTN